MSTSNEWTISSSSSWDSNAPPCTHPRVHCAAWWHLTMEWFCQFCPTPPHHSWTRGQSLSCAFFEQLVPQYQQTLFTQLVHISRPFSLRTFDNEPLFQPSTIKSHGKTKTCWALGVIGPCASHHNCLNSILKQKDSTGLKAREGEGTAHFCQMLKKSGFVTSPQTSSSQREDWLVMAFN